MVLSSSLHSSLGWNSVRNQHPPPPPTPWWWEKHHPKSQKQNSFLSRRQKGRTAIPMAMNLHQVQVQSEVYPDTYYLFTRFILKWFESRSHFLQALSRQPLAIVRVLLVKFCSPGTDRYSRKRWAANLPLWIWHLKGQGQRRVRWKPEEGGHRPVLRKHKALKTEKLISGPSSKPRPWMSRLSSRQRSSLSSHLQHTGFLDALPRPC